MSVIAFPEYFEVELLLKRYSVKDNNIDKSLIKAAIFEIRKTNGLFEEHRFMAVIELLEHDWLPTDIPVLLPSPNLNL